MANNELTLVLETEIEKLTPKLIAFNNKELIESVVNTLQNYEGITYTDEQIGEAKKDRAKLNAFALALNKERIRIQKIYMTPCDLFKKQVDEVINKVTETCGKIDAQIKGAEEKFREEKHRAIREYFDSVIGEFATFIPFDKVLQNVWLNKNTSMKSIKEDIDALVSKTKEAMTTIDAFDETDRDFIRSFYFKTLDFGSAMAEYQRLKKQREDAIRFKREQEERERLEAERQEALKPKESPKIAPTSHETPKVEKMVVKFGVEGTMDEIKALKKFLTDNNIKYFAV